MADAPASANRVGVKRLLSWRFLLFAIVFIAVSCLVYAFKLEPVWLRVRPISLADNPSCRIAHISDMHYKGDRAYLERVVNEVNSQNPDIVCITGDFIEEQRYQDEVISILSTIEAPILGISGNHEDWGDIDRGPFKALCLKTGGKWLDDAGFEWGDVSFYGCTTIHNAKAIAGKKRVLLCHYPKVADQLEDQSYDLILTGHTHGGQVRIPFYGALIIPYDSGAYQMGIYNTPNGILNVSPGIGTFFVNFRLNCRPEITVIEF